VIWPAMDGQQFLALADDDAGDIFLEFFLVFGRDEVLTAFPANTTWM